MSTFDELHAAAHSRLNLRKAQKSVAFLHRRKDVTLPDFATMKPGDLPDLAADGWQSAGRVTTDGWTFGREEEIDESGSHGFSEMGRIDTTSVTRTISTTVQETFRRTIREISKGADYSGNELVSGDFLVLDEPEMPIHEEWSLLLLFKDGPVGDEIIFGRLFPTVKIQETGEEAHGTEGVLQQELTWRAFTDEEAGTPVREFYGGPGFESLAEELGYQLAPAALWVAETSYAVGDRVSLSTGETLKATTAGTSGTTEPTAPATVGGTVTDGGVTWERTA